MSQVLYLDSSSPQESIESNLKLFQLSLRAGTAQHFRQLGKLLQHVSVTGASELDLDFPTVVIINEDVLSPATTPELIPEGASISRLNTLSYDENDLLLKHHYKHLNIMTYKLSEFSFTKINQDIANMHRILKNRVTRMKSWAGLNHQNAKRCPCFHSMTNCLNIILENDLQQSQQLREFVVSINEEVDFFSLLKLPNEPAFYKYCIGNWGFIAHELTCDELTFCALLIFQHAFSIMAEDSELKQSDNDVLSFLFSLRDSYRGGNSFHNFRHAVDVLQATFYYLIRIKALPAFAEYTTNFELHPSEQLASDLRFPHSPFDQANSLLDPIQTLALLVSSVGHDVGHPGLNNPFLISNGAPFAKLYSYQSVLENYHSTIFQDILVNHWPVFLNNEHTKGETALNTKLLQVESILATDMANHFEYINKVEAISSILADKTKKLEIKNNLKQTHIILSLIIKCADISNVARPLLISAKWGIVLSREFGEIAQLSKHLTENTDIDSIEDPREFAYFPPTIRDALTDNPNLPGGQLFFINTFADSLFREVAKVLPELTFSAEIVARNKMFWQRVQNGENVWNI